MTTAEPNGTLPAATARKVKKPRLTYGQEIETIRNLPRLQRLVVILKVAGVFLVAIGIEGIVTHTYLLALVFVPLGVFVSMVPIKVRIDACLACGSPLQPGTAICPRCGAPQM